MAVGPELLCVPGSQDFPPSILPSFHPRAPPLALRRPVPMLGAKVEMARGERSVCLWSDRDQEPGETRNYSSGAIRWWAAPAGGGARRATPGGWAPPPAGRQRSCRPRQARARPGAWAWATAPRPVRARPCCYHPRTRCCISGSTAPAADRAFRPARGTSFAWCRSTSPCRSAVRLRAEREAAVRGAENASGRAREALSSWRAADRISTGSGASRAAGAPRPATPTF